MPNSWSLQWFLGWAVWRRKHSLTCGLRSNTLASKRTCNLLNRTDAWLWPSFDGGYGSAYLAKMVGQKKAREIFFLGRNYSLQDALIWENGKCLLFHMKELGKYAYGVGPGNFLKKSLTSIKWLKFCYEPALMTVGGATGICRVRQQGWPYMTDRSQRRKKCRFLESANQNFWKETKLEFLMVMKSTWKYPKPKN